MCNIKPECKHLPDWIMVGQAEYVLSAQGRVKFVQELVCCL